MGKAKKRTLWKNRERSILELDNEKMEKQIIHLKKELYTIKKRKVKKYTIETKFDKFGNKVSMLETSNEADYEKVTKENNISLSRDPTASLSSGTVEPFYKHDILLVIEAE